MRVFKVILMWFLLLFGLFYLIYPRITHHPLTPIFHYGNLKDYPFLLIPFVYTASYLSRAWGVFIFAFLLGGVISSFFPKEKMRNALSGKKKTSYILAALFAPFLTVCSCAMIPVFGGILMAGAGIGPAVSFLLMAPALNILALIFTAQIISGKLALARFIGAFFGAVITGYILDKTPWGKKEAEKYGKLVAQRVEEGEERNFQEKSIDALQDALDLARKALPYLLLGVALVSYVEAYLPREVVARYLTGLKGVVLGAVIGVPMYTPTLVEVFLVKALINLGMSPGASLAFLIGAPMASIPSMLGVSRIISPKCVITYAILAILMGIISGLIYTMVFRTF